ncbi:hypothetical protein HDZ31DRAFT_62083 [Schizophyllum fasciatum]
MAGSPSTDSSPSTSTFTPHHKRHSLPRTLHLLDGPPVTKRRSLDFGPGDRPVTPSAASTMSDSLRPSERERPRRLLAERTHLPTIPSPIEPPSDHDITMPFSNEPAPLLTPPATPGPAHRRKSSISYYPPDSPSQARGFDPAAPKTRRRSSVIYDSKLLSSQGRLLEDRRRSLFTRGSEPPTRAPAPTEVGNVQHARDFGHAHRLTWTGDEVQARWSAEPPPSAPVLSSFPLPVRTFDDPPRTAVPKFSGDGTSRYTVPTRKPIAPDPFASTSLTLALEPEAPQVDVSPQDSDSGLPLAQQHRPLLHAIAQEEARCAELRGQLAVREARLMGLKQNWEDRVVERYPERARERERQKALDALLKRESHAEEGSQVGADTTGDGSPGMPEDMSRVGAEGWKTRTASQSSTTLSSSFSLPSSSAATIPSPSSSTSSLSSVSSSGLRNARRWVRSLFACPNSGRSDRRSPSVVAPTPPATSRLSHSPAPAAPTDYGMPRHRVSMPYASGLSCVAGDAPIERASCDSNKHWHRRMPSEMTIFAPEEEWVWAWYFVGR